MPQVKPKNSSPTLRADKHDLEIEIIALEATKLSLEASIDDLKRQMKLQDKAVASRDDILSDKKRQIADLEVYYNSSLKNLNKKIDEAKDQLSFVSEKVKLAKDELRSINSTSEQRRDYQKEQELIIASQAEAGNLQLKGLHFDVLESSGKLKEIKSSIRVAREDHQLLEDDFDRLRQDFQPEIEKHQSVIDEIKSEIELATTELLKLEKQKQRVIKDINHLISRQTITSNEIDAKLATLDIKEREVMAKREALRIENEEMDEKRHHFSSRNSLYEL